MSFSPRASRRIPGEAVAVAVLLAGAALAFALGRFSVSPSEIFAVLLGKLGGPAAEVRPGVEAVVLQIRGPRVVAAIFAGAALAVAGTAFQGLFRNPLVSPDILGASSGAALGAVIGIYFSLGVFGIQALAFAGGLAAVAAVYAIGSALRRDDPILVLVLSGIVLGSLLGAGVGLVKYLADPYEQLPAMTFWLLGSLAGTTAKDLVPLLGPVLVGSAILLALRFRLNALSLPDEEARALGLPTGLAARRRRRRRDPRHRRERRDGGRDRLDRPRRAASRPPPRRTGFRTAPAGRGAPRRRHASPHRHGGADGAPGSRCRSASSRP